MTEPGVSPSQSNPSALASTPHSEELTVILQDVLLEWGVARGHGALIRP